MLQERRSLRLVVGELGCEREGAAVLLRFRLARGCFATAVLTELITAADSVPESLNVPVPPMLALPNRTQAALASFVIVAPLSKASVILSETMPELFTVRMSIV